jgi:hypothetical protein
MNASTIAYKPLLSITQIRQAVQAAGSHFFSPNAMRFFNSRVSDTVYPTADGTYFITSEQDHGVYISSGWVPGAWDNQRRYTVRFCAARELTAERHGHTRTYQRGELVSITDDDFCKYKSRGIAHTVAKRLQAERGGYPAS